MSESVLPRTPAKPPFLTALAVVLLVPLVMVGCGAATDSTAELTPEQYAAQFQTQLIEAQPGDVIEIPAGFYSFERSLSLNVDNVTLRGAGMDNTTLSFKGQIQGAEGLLVNASDFVIEDLAIEDAKGDALKVNEGENIVIRNVRTEWTGGPAETNGSYGIYPVQTRNVLVEGCVAIAASDAGIYVGQSNEIIVRNNRAEYNVAGIEIENSINADVYDNVAVNNTGGILVFNMPQLEQLGHSTRVYNNQILNNNTPNFAPKGTAVAGVPAGSGVVISSNDRVEIFDNDIRDNQTANVWISSYMSSSIYGTRTLADDFDPYPEGIYIYGNRFEGGGDKPDRDVVERARVSLFGEDGRVPDVVWDGYANPEKAQNGVPAGEHAICLDNGDSQLLNADSPNENQNPRVSMEGHDCSLEKLSPVALPGLISEASY